MRTLYIHIGTGKTGTTALQNFLAKNSSILNNQGYHYITTLQSGNNHHEFCANYQRMINKSDNDTFNNLEALKSEIQNSSFKNFIISSEYFPGNNANDISNISSVLSSIVKIKFVLYLRRQDEYVESWYSQVVKSGLEEGTIDNLIQILKNEKYLDYKYLIDTWTSILGEESAIIRKYQKNMFYGKNIFSDFLHSINIPNSESFLTEDKDPNPGLKREQIILGNELLRINPSLSLETLRTPVSFAFKSTNWLSFDQKVKLLSSYEDTNKYIAARYFSSEELFTPPVFNDENEPSDIYSSDFTLMFLLMHKYQENSDKILSAIADLLAELIEKNVNNNKSLALKFVSWLSLLENQKKYAVNNFIKRILYE
ncbi:hypothetical protein Q4520_19055 [Alteromonas sp. 1_MG-2023]|uniref:hypothetical protein n=1 Tax=Alteromonas sp. 1_MG-2023 TaxID=3062669 RepID=UPI0026E39986|nr:hypothetical protein [Alteromonas sp. 1_MG-2023]MDO6477527.1 hypothetical protein [Alteromonas sp. 1_MG-2023]